MRQWILPGVAEDPVQAEADHLMKMGDENKVTCQLPVFQVTQNKSTFVENRDENWCLSY